MRLVSTVLAALTMMLPSGVFAVSELQAVRFTPGGRFEYILRAEEEPLPFQWNFDSSTTGSSRLMLDLTIDSKRWGAAYIKGDAVWDQSRVSDGRKLFDFNQADYSWEWEGKKSSYSFVLFANERRFFPGEMIAPLLHDDFVSPAGENRGLRASTAVGSMLSFESILASVGGRWKDARKIAYARSALLHRMFLLSLSYLYDVPPQEESRKHALFKSELSWFYRRASLIFSYQQSGYGSGGLFFPRGDFHWDKYVGDNFSSVLPDGGAFFSEVRIMSAPLRKVGRVDIVHSYFAVGRDFISDLGIKSGEKVGYVFGAYFMAEDVFLNARVEAGKCVRSKLENDKLERIEASIWGSFKGGAEFVLRGGLAKTTDDMAFTSRSNRILGALNFHSKKMRNGIHLMLRDIDTIFSSRDFAWDSRVVLNPDFAVDLRFILSKASLTEDALFLRLEFRPSQRLYASFSYGRPYLGDGPFLLEDEDLTLSRYDSSVYTISVRGDF